MLTFSTEPCGVTSSSSFDAEAVVLKVRKIKIIRLNFVGFRAQDLCFTEPFTGPWTCTYYGHTKAKFLILCGLNSNPNPK